jgi:6-phosphogluconolactonase
MAAAPQVEVLGTPEELADHVAGLLLRRIGEVQAAGRTPAIVLTGGSIAERLHSALARLSVPGDQPEGGAHPTEVVDWSRVDVWWGDERFVPAGDEQRNAGLARAALLDVVGTDRTRVHEVPASDSGFSDVAAAAAAYDAELRTRGPGRFDVVMLGIGPDGHVASLFPGRPELDVDHAAAVAVTDSPKPPPERVSLTFGALNRAREVWFIAAGEAKADAVARAVAGADVHDVPAAGVHGQARTTWFLDRAAASALPG